MTKGLERILFALVAGALFASHAAAIDMVVLVRKNSKTGKHVQNKGMVLRDDAEGVKLRLPGAGEIESSRKQVLEVVYNEGRLTDYKRGLAAFKGGQYVQALDLFEKALDQQHKELLTQYILYYMGLTHQLRDETAKAIEVFVKLKGLGTKTRFLLQAYGKLVELKLDAGDMAGAKEYLAELKKLRRSGRGGGIGAAEIALLEGRIEEVLKRYRQALACYNTASDQGDPETASAAQMGIARCYIGLKRYREAVKRLEAFIKRPRTRKAYAQAYLLIGDALKAKMRTPEDREKALMAYLRVHLQYPGDEKTEARAIYEAADCYKQIGGVKGTKRSGELLSRLKKKYPNSGVVKKLR